MASKAKRQSATTAPAETAWVSVAAWLADVEAEQWDAASTFVQNTAASQLVVARWVTRGGDDAYSRGSAGARR
jgi:hypothetical protein